MIEYNRYSWWKTVFTIRGTALRRAGGRVIGITLFSILVQSAFAAGTFLGLLDVGQFDRLDPSGHAVLGSLLGFLIVFRMNGSNNRYWEGRSHWGQIINSSRNLVRAGAEYSSEGGELAELVSGYVIWLRQSLRGQRDPGEAADFLSEEVCREASRFGNPPTAITARISNWIHRQLKAGLIDTELVRHMEWELSRMVDAQGGCEKILKTPLPFVYVAMIKQLLLVYLVTLPIVLVERCGWWTPMLVAVISLGFLGLEEASVETEDPFGIDDNCLDLEACTLTIARDTGQLAIYAEARSAGAGLRTIDMARAGAK